VAGGDAELVACDTIVFVDRGGGPLDPFLTPNSGVLCLPVNATMKHPTVGCDGGFTGDKL
jgi:hypothetical protein